MSFKELVENVKRWSADKEIDNAEPMKQMQKLNEEWGELNAGKAKSDNNKLYDSVGDILVVLTILSQQMRFENIDQLLDPTKNGYTHYAHNDVSTDMLLLYGSKEIGLIANCLLDLIYNPGVINTRTQIKFHIRSIVGVLFKVAINEGTDMITCFDMAWNEIKDRKGRLIDDVWVKDADLKVED